MFSFVKGFIDCFSGFGLIFQTGVKRYVIIPFVVNAALFTGAFILLKDKISDWVQQILPSWLGFLDWLIEPLFFIVFALITYYSFTLIANLIASPFNSLLSSRIEANLTGVKPVDINSDNIFKLLVRTVGAEIKKIIYSIKWMVPLIVLTFVPGINIIAPLAWILFAAWFFALEYSDYPLANRGQLFDEVRHYNRRNRMRAFGLGSGVFILSSIPFINFIAMPVAVAAATRMTVKIDQQNKQRSSQV